MINIKSFLDDGMSFINSAGAVLTPVKFINYYVSGNDYDDVLTQTLTGSEVVSGVYFPIKSQQGSAEAMLLEQGKLLLTDKVLYTPPVTLTGSSYLVVINNTNYSIIPDGVLSYEINGSVIYNKFFIRNTLNGSLW